MIDIKDFPEGTNLQYLYTAPITDYYNKKLPVVFNSANQFYLFEYFIRDFYKLSYLRVPLFFDKLDFSEVEYLDFKFANGEYPQDFGSTSENLVLDLPKIKKIKFNYIQVYEGKTFRTLTLNCGKELEVFYGRPEFSSSYPGIFTLNSNSKKITSLNNLKIEYLYEIHINCDCEKLTVTPYNSTYSEQKNLTYHSGFPNCKYAQTGNYYDKLPNLTYESIMSIINNLYDFRGNGDTTTTRTLKIHSNAMAMLTDDDKAIAVNKGWTLTS